MTKNWDDLVRFPRHGRWNIHDEIRIRQAYPRLKAHRLVARELRGFLVRSPKNQVPRVGEYSRKTRPPKGKPITREHLIQTFRIADNVRRRAFFDAGDLFYDRENKELLTLTGVGTKGVHYELLNDSKKRYLTYFDFTPPRFILIELADLYAARSHQMTDLMVKIVSSHGFKP